MRLAKLARLVAAVLPIIASAVAISGATSNATPHFSKRSTVGTILADIEDAATCAACEVWFYLK
jgi:hypothetical protein